MTTTPHRRLVTLMAAVALLATGCGRPGDTATEPASPPGASTSTETTTPTTAASVPPSSPRSSAADQLAGFLSGAQDMDRQLRDTAALINTGVGTRTMKFDAKTLAAINAIDPRTLVKAIPGGLPADLQNKVYLVFSELAARRYAFKPILETEPGQPIARDSPNGKDVLDGLSHGAAPAARFAADLAATRSLARSAPPVTVAAPGSRASAEVAVHTTYILVRNSGCGTSGGWIQTTPVRITWTPGDTGAWGRSDGTIGGIPFRATYEPGKGWRVELNAC
jgi:hypothetical protein